MRTGRKETPATIGTAPRRHALVLGFSLTFALAALIHPALAAGQTDTAKTTTPASKTTASKTTASKPAPKPVATTAKPGAMVQNAKLIGSAATSGLKTTVLKTSKVAYAPRYSGISCVPYARSVTGIDVKGNAANWWNNAAGLYARGNAPEQGSILNFRATGRMRLGHVAVVTRVLDNRTVEIDHANWWGPGATKGGVSRGIPVVDVSEANDWSSVRVGLGHSGDYGSIYPTYGFIYGRPDTGSQSAAFASADTPSVQRVSDSQVIHREIR